MKRKSFYTKNFGKIDFDVLEQIEDIKVNGDTSSMAYWNQKRDFVFNHKTKEVKVIEQTIFRSEKCPIEVVASIIPEVTDKQTAVECLCRKDVGKLSEYLLNYLVNTAGERALHKIYKDAEANNCNTKCSSIVSNFIVKTAGENKFRALPYRYCNDEELLTNQMKSGKLSQNTYINIANNVLINDTLRNKAFMQINTNNYKKIENLTDRMIDEILTSCIAQLTEPTLTPEEKKQVGEILKKMIELGKVTGTHFEDEIYDICTHPPKGMKQTYDAILNKILPITNNKFILDNCSYIKIYSNPNIDPKRIDEKIDNIFEKIFKKKHYNSTAFWQSSFDFRDVYQFKTTTIDKEEPKVQKKIFDKMMDLVFEGGACSPFGAYLNLFEMSTNPITDRKFIEEIAELHKRPFDTQYNDERNHEASLLANVHLLLLDGGINKEEMKETLYYLNNHRRIETMPFLSEKTNIILSQYFEELLKQKPYPIMKCELKRHLHLLKEQRKIHEKYISRPDIFVKAELYDANIESGYIFDFKKALSMSPEEKLELFNTMSKNEIYECRENIKQYLWGLNDCDFYNELIPVFDLSIELSEFQKERKHQAKLEAEIAKEHNIIDEPTKEIEGAINR